MLRVCDNACLDVRGAHAGGAPAPAPAPAPPLSTRTHHHPTAIDSSPARTSCLGPRCAACYRPGIRPSYIVHALGSIPPRRSKVFLLFLSPTPPVQTTHARARTQVFPLHPPPLPGPSHHEEITRNSSISRNSTGTSTSTSSAHPTLDLICHTYRSIPCHCHGGHSLPTRTLLVTTTDWHRPQSWSWNPELTRSWTRSWLVVVWTRRDFTHPAHQPCPPTCATASAGSGRACASM